MTETTNQALVFGWISLLVIGTGVTVVLGSLYSVIHQKKLSTAVVAALALAAAMLLHPVLASVSYKNGELQLVFEATTELSGIAGGLADELARVTQNVETLTLQVKDLAEQVTAGTDTGSGAAGRREALSDIAIRADELSNRVSASGTRLEALQQRSIALEESLPSR